ncbi:MAG: ATP-binding protein [Spirulinaceae cyanobacterium SM2_1_0]|nr:ATP-binding protein [Spirulinaceae cyanobacterium SM2_1_0]
MEYFLKTSLTGKINNLPQFKGEALLPVFEAVVNSIQAIEERGNLRDGKIVVKVERDGQGCLPGTGRDTQKIIGFEIIDDGVGFDEVNFESFLTSDTTHKLVKGCKGIGRFFWLKAFSSVEVDSIYTSGISKRRRSFRFNKKEGIADPKDFETTDDAKSLTSVKLVGFQEEYRKQQSAYKTTKKIAQRILEHCLSYFISNSAPLIFVEDETEGEKISLNELFENEILENVSVDEFKISEHKFQIHHIKLYSTYNKMHNLVFCGRSREVKSFNISNLLGTSTQFDESSNKFIYSAYLSSSYLDENVSQSRIDFEIPETLDLLTQDSFPISLDDLKSEAIKRSKIFLKDYIESILDRKKELVEAYVEKENPTLRSVIHYCPEIYDEIDPNASVDRINEVLYKYKGQAELDLRRNSRELLKTQASSVDEIKEDYEQISEKLGSFQKDQLAAYIISRKMIIDLLEKKLEINKVNGRYHNEDIIHDIIFPRKATTHKLGFEDHNMWLIDERLTFHSFATSDNRLCDTTDSDSKERPDIVVFAEVDDDKVARAVSIIELKKPQKTQFNEDPTRQVYRYVRRVSGSTVKTVTGRKLSVSDSTRFYCYVICDLTEPVVEYAENNNYAKMKGELGYYSYSTRLQAHTEIIDFDKIVVDVRKRHKAFF